MIVLTLLWEQLPNFGHGKLGKVMEKVMESHGILKALKSTNRSQDKKATTQLLYCYCYRPSAKKSASKETCRNKVRIFSWSWKKWSIKWASFNETVKRLLARYGFLLSQIFGESFVYKVSVKGTKSLHKVFQILEKQYWNTINPKAELMDKLSKINLDCFELGLIS